LWSSAPRSCLPQESSEGRRQIFCSILFLFFFSHFVVGAKPPPDLPYPAF
jgi:hypothetical protein